MSRGANLNQAQDQDPICEVLEWDSHFFGCRIARLEQSRLLQKSMQAALEWCSLNQIDCLYFAAASDDDETVAIAEANDFHLVDVRITLEVQLDAAPPKQHSVRPFDESDLPMLTDIAAASHYDSRFYYDRRFPRPRVDDLYRIWIERSCRGWADRVFVAESNGKPVGYVSCHLHAPDTGSIGLLAVSSDRRGARIGESLVKAALGFFFENGRANATVVTQGRNIASQRLYQRCGFITESVLWYYHRWFSASPFL